VRARAAGCGVGPLIFDAGTALVPERGEWSGRWYPRLVLRNPLHFPVRIALELRVRRGAFEVEGLPLGVELRPGGKFEHRFRLTGGSWRVGGDPCVAATFVWEAGPGRTAGSLTLDAPLTRIRELVCPFETVRVTMVRERPLDEDASMLVRRRGPWLFVSIENPATLAEAGVVAHLDGTVHFGGNGLRLALPDDFDDRAAGVPFSCGMIGREEGAWCIRRWAGGVPGGLGAGAPGRLLSPRRS